ncbi:DUF7553 family protein [Halalkalicoccus tibetensis]|uniref:Uncharacterized protein n=1 Tax=Halalkalicoccus tibetensis TaxID=175632 RepID=A0ABD5V172_9EURY
MSDPDLDQVRTELQHAREADTGELNESLNSLTQALDQLDEEGNEPKPEHLDSIHDELVRLQEGYGEGGSSATSQSGDDEEIRDHLRRARDHVRAYRENVDELSE